MISLPIYLQMVLEYNALEAGLSLAPLSLSMFAVALLAAKKAGERRPSSIIRLGFGLLTVGMALLIPIVPRADSGWYLLVPLVIAGTGLGLLVSQLNNYTLAPIAEERVSEAAGVNSAAGSFGLSFGLAVAGAHHAGRAVDHLHPAGGVEHRVESRPAGAGCERPGGRRRGDEQHEARGAARRPAPRTFRRRSSGSTPTHDRSPSRSRCSFRSSPASSGS